MSLSLDDLTAEIHEYHNRIEQVLSGMDRVFIQIERRVATLEEQLGTLAAAVTGDADLDIVHNAAAELSNVRTDIAASRKDLKGK